MLTKYKLILPGDATIIEAECELPREPGLDALRAIIDPLIALDGQHRYHEHVSVWASYENDHVYRAMDMFVDEEGLKLSRPRNERATTIYRAATMMGRTGLPVPHNPESLSYIVGPAILFSRRVWY